MAAWQNWLKALGSAIWYEVPHALLGLVPFGENMGRIAERFWANLREAQPPAQDKAALEQLVNVPPEEVKAEAKAVADSVAPEAPPEVRSRLAAMLEMAAPLSRRVLARSEDPEGKTVPDAVRLDGPLIIGRFIPQGPPRFLEGMPFRDWIMRERLGVGGFSEVWRVCHPDDEELTAAVKFFVGDEARGRLGEHEVAVLRQVRKLGAGTGVVQLQNFDIKADPPWIQFEYVSGGDLIRYAKHFFGVKSTALIRDLAEIVGTCHRLTPPVVHRDLKPGNVLVRVEGGKLRPVIADFGIGGVSAALELGKTRTTRPTAVLPTILTGSHTALYASPQQVAGEQADPRDDVYALGVMWYQLAAGDLSSGAPTGLWADELKEAGFTDELVRILGACVEPKKAEKRPKDAAELAERLAAAMGKAAPQEMTSPQPQLPPPQEGPASTRKLSSTQGTVRQQADAAHARARVHEKAGEYEEAARLIEPLPTHLQEPGYLRSLRDRAAEMVALEKELLALDREARISWRHRGKVLRLKELSPSLDVADLLAHAPEIPSRFTCQAIVAEMVLVRPGEFWMGMDEEVPRHVVMSEAFYLSVHPVTQAQWALLTERAPSYFRRGGEGDSEIQGVPDAELRLFPVESVSWDEVQEFLKRLNARELDRGWVYRLPTEEEWEYACRGPVPTGERAKDHCGFSFYAPNPSNALSPEQANCSHTSWLDRLWAGGPQKEGFLGRPTGVGAYPANGLGIHDMHGNVWEWTNTARDGEWVVRGGSWYVYPSSCSASSGLTCSSEYRANDLGFRLARVPA